MARGKAHCDSVKAQVMAALLTGQGVMEIAEKYNLPESSVRNWKKEIPDSQLAQVSVKKKSK